MFNRAVPTGFRGRAITPSMPSNHLVWAPLVGRYFDDGLTGLKLGAGSQGTIALA